VMHGEEGEWGCHGGSRLVMGSDRIRCTGFKPWSRHGDYENRKQECHCLTPWVNN